MAEKTTLSIEINNISRKCSIAFSESKGSFKTLKIKHLASGLDISGLIPRKDLKEVKQQLLLNKKAKS